MGSFPTFAAFAQQKERADALSVRFLRAALSISRLQRRAALRPFGCNFNPARWKVDTNLARPTGVGRDHRETLRSELLDSEATFRAVPW